MDDDHLRPDDGNEPDESGVARAGGVRPVDLRDYVDFSQEHARRIRVFTADHLALDLWCLEPQQATGVLQYPATDVQYTVVGGRSWFVTEEGEVGLDALGSLLVPAGTIHGIDNRGIDPLIVTAASAPPSRDEEDAPVGSDGAAIRPVGEEGGPLRALRRVAGRALGR